MTQAQEEIKKIISTFASANPLTDKRMSTTISIESILQMLHPLSADNKLWLGEKLIEEAKAETHAPCQYTVEEMESRIAQAEKRAQHGDWGLSDEEANKELLEALPWLQ